MKEVLCECIDGIDLSPQQDIVHFSYRISDFPKVCNVLASGFYALLNSTGNNVSYMHEILLSTGGCLPEDFKLK